METQTIKSNGSTAALYNDNSRLKAEAVAPEDIAMATARRRFISAVEQLNCWGPNAEQLTEAARAVSKVANKIINPRKGSEDA